MDVIDILVSIVILVVIIGSELVKKKKRLVSTPQENTTDVEEMDEFDDIPERMVMETPIVIENEKFEDNSSKLSSYLSYEDVSILEENPPTTIGDKTSISNENHLQEPENETERIEIDLHNSEEFKKAIIYGEILKNPYN